MSVYVCICAHSLCVIASSEVYIRVFMDVCMMHYMCQCMQVCAHAYVCGFSLVCILCVRICDRHYLMQIRQCTQIAGCVSKADRQMNLIC